MEGITTWVREGSGLHRVCLMGALIFTKVRYWRCAVLGMTQEVGIVVASWWKNCGDITALRSD